VACFGNAGKDGNRPGLRKVRHIFNPGPHIEIAGV
jgi:hypothetical protein